MRRLLLLLPLAACAAFPDPPPPGPLTHDLWVVQHGWHTDVCLRAADADAWTREMARAGAGDVALCFGFGEKRYAAEHDHSLLTMAAALLPSDAVVMTTALRAAPGMAYEPEDVVALRVSAPGLAGLRAFLRRSSQGAARAHPEIVADGAFPGSYYLAATASYGAFNTCNTWTGAALYAAGLPMRTDVLFAGDVMTQARQVAARQRAGGA